MNAEPKSVVLNLRVSPAMMETLEALAVAERRPVRSMAAILLEDALVRVPGEPEAPPALPRPSTLAKREVEPFFRTGKKGQTWK
jgi:hypothetical protein